MENFTNEIIDTKALPRFEQVQLSPIDAKYWQVILIIILTQAVPKDLTRISLCGMPVLAGRCLKIKTAKL